jgi:dCMP deaminase
MADDQELTTSKYQRPSWDEYFMKIVEIVGTRGTCDRFRGGCVITRNKRIIATGYAGSPVGLPHCDDAGHEMHTITHENGEQSRHCIRTTHAEQNAICEAARMGIALDGGCLYVQMAPCYTCAKMIINAGIKKVVCAKGYHSGQRSQEIFQEAGIEYLLLDESVSEYPDMK